MTFVSYAQNFEDVMLWRALKHVEHGCYVDVGAQHPVIDSVSRAFYEHGWRGIHIEPVPEFAELLRQDRPDETVLQIALSDVEGTLELNVLPGTGLSTFVDDYAGRHRVQHGFEAVRVTVPMLTLAQVLRDNAGRDTHWLKIDVEGYEERVLKGWDSKAFRPWIIVIEATLPGSQEQRHASWDPILVAADYRFVYFDGLNRFYIAREHPELEDAFSSPPNVFDGVQLSGQASSLLCRGLIDSHRASIAECDARAGMLVDDLDVARQRAQSLELVLDASLESEASLQANVQQLQEDLASAAGRIAELASGTLALQEQWDASRRNEAALERQVAVLDQQASVLDQQVSALEQQVSALDQQVSVLDQQVSVRDQQAGVLQHEAAVLGQQAAALNAEIKWLQGELSATQAKSEEHRLATHHWWSVADGLNQELRSVYSSRSWRATAPLRHAMRTTKAVSLAALRAARRVAGMPVRAARSLLRPGKRITLETLATPQPNLPAHTQPSAETELRSRMSPRAYRILAQLQRSIAARVR